MNRPMGKILIQYDPNTGELDYKCEGLTLLEVSGLLNFLHHKQLNKLGVGLEEESPIIPATVMPSGKPS